MEAVMNMFKNVWSKTNRWHRVLSVFIVVELLLPSRQMGFHCNDPALSHPFSGDTISWKWLLSVTAFLPLVVMLIVERKFHPQVNAGGSRSKSKVMEWYKEYFFGLLCNLTLIQTLKIIVGSPRPHFFDSCRPQEAATCQGSEYIASYKCLENVWVQQASKSFPSGHSSLSVHAGLFIIWYLHTRMPRDSAHSRALVLKSQITSAIASAVCCVSRLTDQRHHWWDVVSGVVIGVVILAYTIVILCKSFECPPEVGRGDADDEKLKENPIKSHNNVSM